MGFIKYIILFLLFVFGSVYINAQSYLPKNNKAKKYYKKGKNKFESGHFDKAILYFEKALKNEPDFVPVYYQLAGIYYKKNDYAKSEEYYKQSLKVDSLFNSQVYYSLGIVSEKQGKLKEALYFYKKFLSKSKKGSDLSRKARLKVKNLPFRIYSISHPVSFEPKPVGDRINTIANEYLPVLTGDNSQMIFTRNAGSQEDFYISRMQNGKWGKAKPLSELNTGQNEGAQSITPDGKTIYFTVCDRSRTYGSCDLMMAKKVDGKWTNPRNLGNLVNSRFWESQPSISADNKTLFFASNRPGCIGGKDIWYSRKNSSGKWTQPVCLDTVINTKSDEKTPFIHPDNKTLYFTSAGHSGLGGLDLFVSRKINGKWSKPQNLGYPVNTENDEGGLFVTLDGKTAYFSTDRGAGTQGNLDIYYYELDSKIKPDKVTYVKGVVYDKETSEKLSALLELYDNKTGEKIFDIQTDRDTFLIPLNYGKDYNFAVSKPNYIFYSGRFNLIGDSSTVKSFVLKIALTKIFDFAKKKAHPVVLQNVFFKYNSAELDTISSGAELNKLIQLLKTDPKLKIKIIGHTDNIGSPSYNMKLSLNRAKAVYDFLVSKHINKNRLKYEGAGSTKPLVSNNTEEGRSKNRRTEFIVFY